MSWRNLKRRIFKDRRFIGLNIYPTSQCDTGCAHCIDSCDLKNPVHFSKELALEIVKEARRERWKLSVLFTGYGEPLMAPELLEIADTFADYERFDYIGMITSGFTSNEQERKDVLGELLKRPYGKDIFIDQSFNLYHESFPERLANMARLIVEHESKINFRVRACMSMENAVKTQLEIEKVIKNLAKDMDWKYVPILLGYHEMDRRLFRIFENVDTDDAMAWRMKLETFLTPQWHALKTKTGSGVVMHVLPVPFEAYGRGKDIRQSSFGRTLCGSFLADFTDTYLVVAPDGSVFPECSCLPDTQMCLGRIGEDSLVDLVKRKDIFFERIFREILSDNRMCEWGTNDVCRICKQIVAEKGIGLR